jgi:hypothetical protein
MIKTKSSLMILVALITILFSFQASAGCGRWVVRDNTDYLADPIFDATFKDPEETKSSKPNVATDPNDSSIGPAMPAQESPKDTLDVSGKWQIALDKAESYLNIFLIQSGDRFQGYGSLVENGTATPATANGAVSEDSISLDANIVVDGTLNNIKKKYKLNLFSMNETLAGSYEYFEADKLEQRGNATATMV